MKKPKRVIIFGNSLKDGDLIKNNGTVFEIKEVQETKKTLTGALSPSGVGRRKRTPKWGL